MKKTAHISVIVSWIIFYPLAIWAALRLSDFSAVLNRTDLVILAILAIVVSMFPIKVLESNISLIQGISLAVFLYYGVAVSLFITQLAVIALFLIVKVPVLKEYYRYLANTLMFAWISVISGLMFHLLGGRTGRFHPEETIHFIPLIGYILTYLIINHCLIFFIKTFLYRQKTAFIDRDLWWDLSSEVIVLPVGFILYMLYSQMGRPAIFYVGFPFISLSIIINLYHSSQQINNLLQKASEIGQQLAEHLKVNDILDIFIEKLIEIMPVDYAFIFDTESGEYFKVIRNYEKYESTLTVFQMKRHEGVSGRVWSTGRSIRYNSQKQWSEFSNRYFKGKAQSIISVPMIRNQKIVGIITFASQKKWAYQKHHLIIMEILANYLAVAIDNARNYESTKLKSEQCPLTGLYNYRYFEDLLGQMFTQYTYFRKHFSVILLDIDHFKAVNDTYGHQSGNEVLCQLANRLESAIGNKGTVARYGGEEFIILLPETGAQEGFFAAELLRSVIADQGFIIKNDLTDKKRQMIYITASIGVATAPVQGEDPLTLIRNADRAMYTGAKQQGRNKVASYTG